MSIPLSLVPKVRCRFLDRSTGKPIPGLVASLSATFGESSAQLPIGTLCTDSTGYMAFHLKPLQDFGLSEVDRLLVSSPRFGLRDHDLLESLGAPSTDAENGDVGGDGSEVGAFRAARPWGDTVTEGKAPPCLVFPVYVADRSPEKKEDADCQLPKLPSVQAPDLCDYKASPFSFVTQTAVTLGDGCCETLVPATNPVQEFRFYKVVVRRNGDVELDETEYMGNRNRGSEENMRVFDSVDSSNQAIKFGEVLHFRQRWYSLGHSLGEIKYSLPLAPGESTQLAVIEWSRQDLARRTDNVSAREYLDHDARRDRTIEETVDSALKEEQGGWSFMIGSSGQATLPLQYVTLSFNHAIGAGVSHTWGNRKLEADSLQEIHDRVRQASSSVRSLNSTVIVQASQSENSFLQTRRVANHNHCHALTLQYYEVLRQLRVTTEFEKRRKAVLVPFTPFAFNWQITIHFRSILEQALLDQSLRPCFDAIVRLKLASFVYDAPTNGKAIDSGTKTLPAVTKKKSFDVLGVLGEGTGSGIVVKKDDFVSMNASGEITIWGGTPGGVGAWSKGPNGDTDLADSTFLAPTMRKFSLLYKIGQSGPWRQGGTYTSFTADRDGEIVFGVNDQKGYFSDDKGFGNDSWKVEITYPSHDPSDPQAPGDPKIGGDRDGTSSSSLPTKSEDELATVRLLTHLDGNRGYYMRAVWMLMDVAERRLVLERALRGRNDILDAIDEVPIAISGNYVAFPYDGPLTNWEDSRADDPTEPMEDLVTLPTRGLFAEAQLGHCNSCEKRDVTRMWDWTVMTAEEPPKIEGIKPGASGQIPSLTPSALPTNVIQIQQPPAAPDPTGLAKALEVLKTPDIFRDMSGLDELSKLLQELSKESSEANIKAMALKAQEKVDAMKSSGGSSGSGGSASGKAGGGGSGDGAGTVNRSQPNETDAGRQVDKLKVIDQAKQDGLISEKQANSSALGVLGGEIIPAIAIDRNITMPMGVDVSHFQRAINWDRVRSANIYFAFIKASEANFNDAWFQTNWVNARKADVMCGAYHFWRPQLSGKSQAETLLRQIGFLKPGDLPPVIDIEDSANSNFTGLSVADLEDNIQEFMDTVYDEFNVYPIIYTNPGFWKARMNNSTKFSQFLLWIANYDPKSDPTLPGGWPAWDFWQLTDHGKADGITGDVDMNVYSADLETLWRLARKPSMVGSGA